MNRNAQSNSNPSTKPRIGVLLLAAGSGSRAGGDLPKQYQMLGSKPVLGHTLQAFAECANEGVKIDFGVLVLAPDDANAPSVLPQLDLGVFEAHFVGGASRAESTVGGLQVLLQLGMQAHDWVLVHDAARCLIDPKAIAALVEACYNDKVGGLLAQPVGDTLKQGQSGRVQKTIERSDKWQAQTPQMFRLGLLQQALQKPKEQITDEASAVEALGLQPQLVANDSINFKLTYAHDFALAQAVLEQRAQARDGKSGGFVAGQLRIGEGFDVHALVDAVASGRQLILGGVPIPFTKALKGHSDADVLLHAITDAVLGAAGLGDIGRHFPDTDAAYQGADSRKLLQSACASVREAGFAIVNVDATIIAQEPKLVPHMKAIVASVADCLGVAPAQVNIKAKTAEKLGPVGEGLSMEARAVALLQVFGR